MKILIIAILSQLPLYALGMSGKPPTNREVLTMIKKDLPLASRAYTDLTGAKNPLDHFGTKTYYIDEYKVDDFDFSYDKKCQTIFYGNNTPEKTNKNIKYICIRLYGQGKEMVQRKLGHCYIIDETPYLRLVVNNKKDELLNAELFCDDYWGRR